MTAASNARRYEPRQFEDAERGTPQWGVYDRHAAAYVVGQAHKTWDAALEAAGRLNRAYEKATAP